MHYSIMFSRAKAMILLCALHIMGIVAYTYLSGSSAQFYMENVHRNMSILRNTFFIGNVKLDYISKASPSKILYNIELMDKENSRTVEPLAESNYLNMKENTETFEDIVTLSANSSNSGSENNTSKQRSNQQSIAKINNNINYATKRTAFNTDNNHTVDLTKIESPINARNNISIFDDKKIAGINSSELKSSLDTITTHLLNNISYAMAQYKTNIYQGYISNDTTNEALHITDPKNKPGSTSMDSLNKTEDQLVNNVNGIGDITTLSTNSKYKSSLDNSSDQSPRNTVHRNRLVMLANRSLIKYKPIFITNATEEHHFVILKENAFQKCPNLKPWMKCQFVPSPKGNISTMADAVLFRLFEVKGDFKMPLNRPWSQKWIFYETEAPYRAWGPNQLGLEDIWKSFNISITYNEDADIQYTPYGFECKKKPQWVTSKIDYAKQKTKSVLWVVSNCYYTTGRELYVKELQKYMPVDTYGACGQESRCGKYSDLNHTCVQNWINEYKFYLAFENSFCEEYYTEKIYKTVLTYTIPVVMGLTNYTKLLIPGTFINVRDFKSPKQLASYLTYLSQNDTAYNEYIYRKEQVECKKKEPRKVACSLCKYLHLRRNSVQTLPNIREFWGLKSRCKTKEEFFNGVADSIISKPNK